MLNETFYLDGIDARSVGIYLQSPIQFSESVPVVEAQTIPGRNGDLIWETGSYENRSGSASCFCLQKDVEKAIGSAGRFLMSKKGYRRLETSDDPDHFWLARVENSPRIEQRLRTLAPFEIDFDCKPQRFAKSGERSITFTTSGSLLNSYGQVALPFIVVYLQGDGVLNVGGCQVACATKWYNEEYLDKKLKDYDFSLSQLKSNLLSIGINEDIFYSFLDSCNANAEQFVQSVYLYAMDTTGMATDEECAEALVLSGEQYQTVFDAVVDGNWDNVLYLDCETQNAYNDQGDQNMYIRADEFPSLQAGENEISWTGGIFKIEIKPRWWEL